jgi:polar amino acid transport system substrate-binding protein
MISRRNFFGKTIGIGAAAVGFLGFKSKSAQAATDKRDSLLYKVLDRGKIIVGTGSGNPPWHFEDEKGELQGFDVTMARLLAKGRKAPSPGSGQRSAWYFSSLTSFPT